MIKKYYQYIKESDEPKDIIIKVDGKNYLIDRLIDNLSLVVKKRIIKSFRINSITGHINKESFSKNGYSYETHLEITLTNKDVIIGEYKNNNILIKVNDEIVYDIDNNKFDNEVLIDKITSEYIKYLKSNKYQVN